MDDLKRLSSNKTGGVTLVSEHTEHVWQIVIASSSSESVQKKKKTSGRWYVIMSTSVKPALKVLAATYWFQQCRCFVYWLKSNIGFVLSAVFIITIDYKRLLEVPLFIQSAADDIGPDDYMQACIWNHIQADYFGTLLHYPSLLSLPYKVVVKCGDCSWWQVSEKITVISRDIQRLCI